MVYIYNKHPKVASCQHGHDYIRNPFHSKETCRDNLNNLHKNNSCKKELLSPCCTYIQNNNHLI